MRKHRMKHVMRFLAAGFMILAAAGLLLRSGFTSEAAPEPPITVDVNGYTEYAPNTYNEVFTYRIQTEITDDPSATVFEITDTLESVLEFEVADAYAVDDLTRYGITVNLNGITNPAAANVTVVEQTTQRQTLTVTFTLADEDGDDTNGIQNALQGQQVDIRFRAKMKSGADLTPYKDGTIRGDGRIPNHAAYWINGVETKASDVVYVVPPVEVVDVPVELFWYDDYSGYGYSNMRPNNVTVGVFRVDGYGNNDLMVGPGICHAPVWKTTFADLQKYDSSGVEIPYIVKVLNEAGEWVSIGNYNNTYYVSTRSGNYGGYVISMIATELDVNGGDAYTVDPNTNGDVFTYTIRTTIPDGEGVKNVTVTDTLVDVLEFVDNTVVVEVDGSAYTADYAGTSGQTLTVRFGPETWDDTYPDLPDFLKGRDVTISFRAKVKDGVTAEELAQYMNREVPNKATFSVNHAFFTDSNEVIVTPPPVVQPIDIHARVIWDDMGNQDGVRPVSVSVSLISNGMMADVDADGNYIAHTVSLREGDGWSYTWNNMPKQAGDGTDIIYTIREDSVVGYTGRVMALTEAGTENKTFELEYTYVPAETDVPVRITWQDENDHDGVRPASVQLKLYADGSEVRSVSVSAGNSWSDTFSGLPVNQSGGKNITYHVACAEPADYTVATTGDASSGFEITLRHDATHTWDAGTVTKPATETEEGERTHTCTICGVTKTEPIAKLAHTHTWDAGTVTKPATETEEGVRTFTCSGCGATKTEPIAKLTPANTSNASSTGNTKSNSTNSGTTNASTSNKTNTGSTTPGRSNASNAGSTNSNRSNTSNTGSTTPGRSNASNTGSTNSNRSNASNTGDTTPSRSNTANTGSTTPGRSSAENTARTTGAVLGQNRQSNAETGRPLHSHDWVSAVSAAPTSVASGMREFVCLICGETHGESIAQLDCGHAQKGYGQLPLRAVSKSGCGHAGIVCKDCGKIKSTMTTHTYEAFPVSYADGKTDVVYGWFDDSNVQRLLSGGISGAGDPAMLQLDGTVGHIYFSEKYADAKRALPVRNAGTVFHRLIFSEDGSAPREMKILVSY